MLFALDISDGLCYNCHITAVTEDLLQFMNLVFFDIECAGVYKTSARICAFGYVVCDGQFNILGKEDILVNPKSSFHLTDSRGEKGLVLPYEYGDFKKYPTFRGVYEKIRSLLEDENAIAAGHATYNDVNYLNLETRRFSLPSFNFRFSDTQLMYMTLTDSFSRQYGLEHIAGELGVEFTPHRAADDAYATMRIAEAMCKRQGCTFEELERSLGIARGKIENYSITKPSSEKYAKFTEDRRARKEERSRARRDFYIYLSRKKRRREGRLKGTVFNFARCIEDDTPLSERLLDDIYAAGGSYTQKLAECNVFCAPEGDSSARTVAAGMQGLKIITPEQLEEMLR